MFQFPLSSKAFSASHATAIVSLHQIMSPLKSEYLYAQNVCNINKFCFSSPPTSFLEGKMIHDDMPRIFAPSASRYEILAQHPDVGLGCTNSYTYIHTGLCIWLTGYILWLLKRLGGDTLRALLLLGVRGVPGQLASTLSDLHCVIHEPPFQVETRKTVFRRKTPMRLLPQFVCLIIENKLDVSTVLNENSYLQPSCDEYCKSRMPMLCTWWKYAEMKLSCLNWTTRKQWCNCSKILCYCKDLKDEVWKF